MASSGKKRNKTVWKPAGQNEIFQISGSRYTNWAEEVENETEELYDPKPMVLPTAPRSSCMVAVDETKIPHSPPFQAHVSNLPYDLTEEELSSLFPEGSVKEVKIPKEDRGGTRAKGYGYVVFEDRASLIAALHTAEVVVKGRSIRIELATSDSGRGGGRSRGNMRSDGGSMNSSSVDRTSGNWRSGPREEADDRDRGGPRREYSSGGFSRRDNDGYHERRERDDRFSREKERSFDRPKYDDWPSKDSNRQTNYRRDDRREDPPPRGDPSGESKSRPKLNLKPRSTDLPPPDMNTLPNEPTTSNSIFGNAKPVDTSSRLKMIEDRLIKNEMLSEKSRSAGSSTGSSSSAARSAADVKERKVEPAQLPKENAWSKSRPTQQTPRASRPEEQQNM